MLLLLMVVMTMMMLPSCHQPSSAAIRLRDASYLYMESSGAAFRRDCNHHATNPIQGSHIPSARKKQASPRDENVLPI